MDKQQLETLMTKLSSLADQFDKKGENDKAQLIDDALMSLAADPGDDWEEMEPSDAELDALEGLPEDEEFMPAEEEQSYEEVLMDIELEIAAAQNMLKHLPSDMQKQHMSDHIKNLQVKLTELSYAKPVLQKDVESMPELLPYQQKIQIAEAGRVLSEVAKFADELDSLQFYKEADQLMSSIEKFAQGTDWEEEDDIPTEEREPSTEELMALESEPKVQEYEAWEFINEIAKGNFGTLEEVETHAADLLSQYNKSLEIYEPELEHPGYLEEVEKPMGDVIPFRPKV